LTVEIEHVDAEALSRLETSQPNLKIFPSPDVIKTIQDKFVQKSFFQEARLPLPDFQAVDAADLPTAIKSAVQAYGLPLILKSRTMAYDGRGNYLLRTLEDIPQAISFLGNGSRPLYAERFAPFFREIAVMVVRAADGTVASYPAVETIHKNNICHLVHAPLRSKRKGTARKAQELASKAVAALGKGAVGVFGVEMFEMPDGASSNTWQSDS
jgi:phosphoribosylaminoimidazole carboxylase